MVFSEKIFTTPAEVMGVSPINRWEKDSAGNNVNTGIREGTRVDVLIKTSRFEKELELGVKIESVDIPISSEQIRASKAQDSPIQVLFENLCISDYIDRKGNLAHSVSATGLRIVTDKDNPASTPAPAPPKPTPAPIKPKSTK